MKNLFGFLYTIVGRAKGTNRGRAMKRAHCQSHGPAGKEWDQLPALTPLASSSHWLNHPGTRGKGSPVAAFGGGKLPRAQTGWRRKENGFGRANRNILCYMTTCLARGHLSENDLTTHAIWHVTGPRKQFHYCS